MVHDKHSLPNVSFFQRYQLIFVFLIAFFVVEIPFISIPLKWFESYFHELSHGLAALITGGSIVSIQLNLDGSGLCTTQGGSRLLISFMGYAGASLFGFGLVKVSTMHQTLMKVFIGVLSVVIAISLLLWAKNLLTVVIILFLWIFVTLKLFYFKKVYLPFLFQLTGATVVLNSIKSPLYLFDGRSLGDGAALAQLTFIPEFIWVVIWSVLGMMTTYLLIKSQVSQQY
ncbi:M50 family metallopeptidase [Thalassotalea sp. 1_MG-2023]|uniref:M50 family metallopeptidase n=1 Tax=Thalassotalea sp. 1_MG-2023 TaxID=3062680 RepID=UPI0026E3428E|nr:M50 family metallopeptidase [Thalassotalea sp. 1_MG-2023]MDO6427856.1 M50 family metallopeptidase [Thalassotalea sp. 1_MG-2023]